MDPPNSYMDVNPENPMYLCDLYDAEIVHKIAQAFLPGLASACVDNTTGGLFKSPGSVAVEVRKEMVGYLTQRSETFVAETVNLDGAPEVEVPSHPYDIISNHIDDFAGSKRNFFSKVSTWLLSDRREDRIDDFVQDMEMNGFWLIGRREAVAKTLLRNVDFKNEYHCNMKFNSAQQLSDHIPKCHFRTMICTSEGCNARFCAAHSENHDAVCPFKIIPCEQKCPDELMRRDMDRHCITVCPMKLVNCAFYPVGCQATIPRCNVVEHNSEGLQSHLIYILQTIHKDASKEDLRKRAEQVEKESSPEKLAGARDVRSLTYLVKNIEVTLGPMEIKHPATVEEKVEKEEESKESPKDNKESTESPTKKNESKEMSDSSEVVAKAEAFVESSNDKKENTESEKNESTGSPREVKDSDAKTERSLDSSAKTEAASESSSDEEEHKKEEPMVSKEKHVETEPTITKDDNGTESPRKQEEGIERPAAKEEPIESLTNRNAKSETSSEKEEFVEPPTKIEVHTESPGKNEMSNESPSSPESPEKESRPPSPASPEKSKESRPPSPASPENSRPPSPASPEKSNVSRPPSPASPEKSKDSRPQSPESPSKKEAFNESAATRKEGLKESPSSSDSDQ